jgi:retron-type reverse transcriptase
MNDMTSAKPYSIAKRTVWEAYQLVKANQGSAGIDDETIAMFEQNLPKNLYKLWNRMSSGSYFPPPVKQVQIPKGSGGFRKLGIPTVIANCTVPQFTFGMGGDPPSISSASRAAL